MSFDPRSRLAALGRSLRERFGRNGRLDWLRNRRVTATSSYLAVGAIAGAAVFLLAVFVFPYHSVNHDEGVYLMQASMLLEGHFTLQAGGLSDVFRPWFFVADGGELYPKYSPVPAAMFAVTLGLLGEPRVTLAAVAAGNAVLVAMLGTMVADRRVGILAGILFAASPMALFTSSVFLPYAPTTLLNLLFAVSYLRGVRTGSLLAATVAGVAVGLAAFSRPYTAILFAAPFIVHALWTVGQALQQADRSIGTQLRTVCSIRGFRSLRNPIQRNLLTGSGGLAFVGLTLAYNLRTTGSVLVFPYQAFAPLDGPGFGEREILSHSVEYTLPLALESNGYALQYLGTRWFTGGLLGVAAAAIGLGVALRRWRQRDRDCGLTTGLLLAGLFVSVPVGNIPFWGTHNMLATLSDPTDGLVSHFGPFYYFDLLVPLSVFAALGCCAGWRWLRHGLGFDRITAVLSPTTGRRIAVVVIVVVALAGTGVTAAAVTEPLDRNVAYTEKYETAYEPLESADFDNALVFIPDPYGPWQNHPFQSLRNDPGFDGDVVYARDRGPTGNFEVLAVYPNRSVYRFAYRGEWTPDPDEHVAPKLESLSSPAGSSLIAEARVGVADRVTRATVAIEADGEAVTRGLDAPGETITVNWTLENGSARLAAVDGAPLTSGNTSIPIDATEDVGLRITLVDTGGNTYTYQQQTALQSTPGGVQAVTPAERRVCRLTTDCDPEDTYLPDDPGAHPEWVDFETDIVATD